MARQRVIVGIGEALLVDRGEVPIASGIAVDTALEGVRLGQRGVAVSRLGQDDVAHELLSQLEQRGVETAYLQSDPDHTTARLLIRTMLGKSTTKLDDEAAFDYLQWDFDLHDLAQLADLVVYGALARRSGLTRSIIERFLDECPGALRVFDLTNRSSTHLGDLNITSGLRYANAVVLDESALREVWPAGRNKPAADAARDMLRRHAIDAALLVGNESHQPALLTTDLHHADQSPWPEEMRATGIVTTFYAIMDGAAPDQAFALARRVIDHRRGNETDPIPDDLLRNQA